MRSIAEMKPHWNACAIVNAANNESQPANVWTKSTQVYTVKVYYPVFDNGSVLQWYYWPQTKETKHSEGTIQKPVDVSLNN